MRKMKQKCIDKNTNKVIVFKENRSKLTIINKDQEKVCKIIVDGCQITSGLRCDFMLTTKNLEFFIELKGQDINHALEQIKTTISKLSKNAKKQKKKTFIICTRSPLSSASIQNIRIQLRKNYNSDLIIKSSPYSYKL